jgi:hypothetical protein
MRLMAASSMVPLLVLAVAGIAVPTAWAQVFGTTRNAGVHVQGDGQAMAGTFDEDGFRGIMAGPDGRVRRIDTSRSTNPFLPGRTGRRSRTHRSADGGAFAGASSSRTGVGPGGFDPLDFVFGGSRPSGGIGVFAGDAIDRELIAVRRAFGQGQYDKSLELAERLLRDDPDDVELEQLRGLALFALGRYGQAAAAAYNVLEADAAWEWSDLRRMYPDNQTYLEQLRLLQDSARCGTAADSMFLLAYHYLMLRKVDEARETLEKTKVLRPDIPLVNELLAALPPRVEDR